MNEEKRLESKANENRASEPIAKQQTLQGESVTARAHAGRVQRERGNLRAHALESWGQNSIEVAEPPVSSRTALDAPGCCHYDVPCVAAAERSSRGTLAHPSPYPRRCGDSLAQVGGARLHVLVTFRWRSLRLCSVRSASYLAERACSCFSRSVSSLT